MLIREFNLVRVTAILAAFLAIMAFSLSGAKAHKYHSHFDPGAFIAGAFLGAIISHGYHHHHHRKYYKRSKRKYYRVRKVRRCHRHRCGHHRVYHRRGHKNIRHHRRY